eukprot:gene2210-33768_t
MTAEHGEQLALDIATAGKKRRRTSAEAVKESNGTAVVAQPSGEAMQGTTTESKAGNKSQRQSNQADATARRMTWIVGNDGFTF